MNISKVTGLVERAADTLTELAHELRQVAGGSGQGTGRSGWAPVSDGRSGGSDGGDGEHGSCTCGLRAGEGVDAAIDPLRRLHSFWDGVSMAPVLSFGEARIDLSTAVGRWELLALAVLLGARVNDRIVEATFSALRGEGLLGLERLAGSDPDVRPVVREIFHTHYRALGNKEGKVDALIHNARLLVDVWHGDPHTIYLAVKDASSVPEGASPVDEGALIRTLQSFKHIKQLAYWVCRTMKAHGVWRDLGEQATGYHDRYTRLPLERLGLAKEASGETPRGNIMPLYLQGINLCAQNDVKTCMAECPVALWCPYPHQRAFSE